MAQCARRGERLFSWTGGALFVAALAFAGYSYAVTWATPGTAGGDGPWRAAGLDTLLLGAFALHHSVFARAQVKAWLSQVVPTQLMRSTYVWTASALLILTCWLWQPIRIELYHSSGLFRVMHAGIQLAGVLLIAASVRFIHPLELAGIRSRPPGGGLQTTGPYRLVRHPLYLGWVLLALGAAHMTGDRLVFGVITVMYLVGAVPLEERSLLADFGGEYERYRRDVRWRIVPYVY
jgi:protein-S-isoprenylcysteine O-methyltransferase Ste14